MVSEACDGPGFHPRAAGEAAHSAAAETWGPAIASHGEGGRHPKQCRSRETAAASPRGPFDALRASPTAGSR